MGLGARKPVVEGCKQQGRRLISAFIIHILVSVAVETGLSLALSKTLQTGLSEAHIMMRQTDQSRLYSMPQNFDYYLSCDM